MGYGSFKNNFRIALKNKAVSTIMIISLTIGFTTVFLLTGFVINEYAVDGFHKNKDKVFRLQTNDLWVPGEKMNHITLAAPLYIKDHFPEVVDFCQWNKHRYDKIVVNNNSYFKKIEIFETNPSFFDVFTYKFLEGTAEGALSDKNKVILSEKAAFTYFGNEPALGKSIIIQKKGEDKLYTVSAVVEQAGRSHLEFDMLTSIEGKEYRGTHAYLILGDKDNKANLVEKLNNNKAEIPFFGGDKTVNYFLQSLPEINLTKEIKSKIYISLAIAITVLFIAFFNYINLFINHIFDREKEFNVRKVIGGSVTNLVNHMATQFLFQIGLSLLFSFLCIKLLLPLFNRFNESYLLFSEYFQPQVLISMLGVILFVAALCYLVVFLFIKKPFRFSFSQRNRLQKGKRNKHGFVNIVQYAISIVLIISVITIYRQMNYIEHRDIGLNRDVIEFRLPAPYAEKKEAMKNALLSSPLVENVSICSSSPVRAGAMLSLKYDDVGEKKEYTVLFFQGDEEYIKTLGLDLIKGSKFSISNAQNNSLCYVNKTLVDFFNMEDPVGQTVPGSDNRIEGVVNDFHWTGLESKVEPAMIVANNGGRNILLKMKDGHQQAGIDLIKDTWGKIIPDYPLEYFTTGDLFNEKHKKYERLAEFISFFCTISIILSSMGLIALSLLTIRRKVKEIGIRKVNGAKAVEILTMINKNLISWIFVGLIVSCPLAYYVMSKWLENFAYKTTLSWWVFVVAGLVTISIALLTVSWQTWRAARRNPVEALRYE